MVNREFLKVWHLSKSGCLLLQCSVRASRCPPGRESCRGRRRLEVHKASGRASRSNFCDSPRNQPSKGQRRGWGWGDALLHSDRSSPLCSNWSLFCSYKTQKRTKREIWQIELPMSLLKKSHPKRKKFFFLFFFPSGNIKMEQEYLFLCWFK